jgi:hypothetical protein
MSAKLCTMLSRNLVVRPNAVNALTIQRAHDDVWLRDD